MPPPVSKQRPKPRYKSAVRGLRQLAVLLASAEARHFAQQAPTTSTNKDATNEAEPTVPSTDDTSSRGATGTIPKDRQPPDQTRRAHGHSTRSQRQDSPK